jgi:hypothetical protein
VGKSPSDTSGDTTQVGSRLDLSQMRIVVETQAEACVHLCAFRPGCLTKHGGQPAQLVDQFADLRGRHGAGSFGSLKAGLQLVALGGAATQCSGQVLNGHTRLQGGN